MVNRYVCNQNLAMQAGPDANPMGALEIQEATAGFSELHHKARRLWPKLFAQARSHHFVLLFLARQWRLNPGGASDGASVFWVLSVGTRARSKSLEGARSDRMAEDRQGGNSSSFSLES